MSFVEEIDDEELEQLGDIEEEKREKTPGWDNPELAKIAIKRFFETMSYHSGGPISKSRLCSDEYVNLVINIEIPSAIDIGYALIKQHGEKYGYFAKTGFYNQKIQEGESIDTKIWMSVMQRCHSLHILQEYIGGIFLIYLELCEGIKLPRK